MTDIRIRRAKPEDAPTVVEFIRGLARYEKLEHEMVATEELIHRHAFGDEPLVHVLIAEHGTTPAGFALYFFNFSTFLGRPGLYLEDLFVEPAHRGNGIGKLLLTELARIAVERGCGRFEWSVLDWNEPAIGFYRNLGAYPMDEWTTYRMTGDALARLAEGGIDD
jgi:GNAT superfamily N-acetyltransferase